MSRLQISLAITFASVVFAGCDTGYPDLDYGIGRMEETSGKAAQGVGGVMLAAPEAKVKIAGGGLVVTGVALEADGVARMERATIAKSSLQTSSE